MERTIKVPLTKGHFALIDEKDKDVVASYQWIVCDQAKAGLAYAMAKDGRKSVMMHRLLTGCPDGMVVDHINGDGLDNRRSNLQVCRHRDNIRKATPKRGASGYIGVTRHPRISGYQAIIRGDDKRHYLGSFDCPIEAAIFRDVAAIELHGEFASLNFPHLAEVLSPRSHQS